jgi:hypothetical protein
MEQLREKKKKTQRNKTKTLLKVKNKKSITAKKEETAVFNFYGLIYRSPL